MSDIFETYKGFVYPWNIDHVGHMNVQFYVAKFDEASWHFLAKLGLTPTYFKNNNRGIVAAEQNIQYKKEVHSGSIIGITSELIEIKNKVIQYKHTMKNYETFEELATMIVTTIHIDTILRKSCNIPNEILQKGLSFLK